ncbi:MAG: hypothetical protein QOJ57_2585 [Thermoleophilaceae bacterium]|nr:hypothetical protein [Thermoleophilaceae bacterium]
MPAGADWIDWSVKRVVGTRQADGQILPDRASIQIDRSGALDVERARAEATLTSLRPLTDEQFVHPYLGAVAAVVSRWWGRPSFHSAGFVLDGGAWGVLGDPGRGKSTLVAALAAEGLGVICDDLLVVRDGFALAGPRCVDLREDAARAIGEGHSVGVIGARERWRMPLSSVPPETPMRGWVTLTWADSVSTERVGPADRLRRLTDNVTIVPGPPSPSDLLDLAALPMIELARPRGLDNLTERHERLIAACAAAG